MNATNVFIADTASPQPVPAEPRAAARPAAATDGKTFARIMKNAFADVSAEPTPKQDAREKRSSEKKGDNTPGAMANTPLPAVMLSMFSHLPLGQTTPAVQAETSASSEAMGPNVVPPGNPTLPIAPVVLPSVVAAFAPGSGSMGGASSIAGQTPEENHDAQSAIKQEWPQPAVLPSVVPVAVPASGSPGGLPSIAGQTPKESLDAEATIKQQWPQPAVLPSVVPVAVSAGGSPGGLPSIAGQTPKGSLDAEATIKQEMPQPVAVEDDQALPAEQVKPSAPDGTVIAELDNRMKRDVKVDNNSEPAEKSLPRGNFSTVAKAVAVGQSRREVPTEVSTRSAEPSSEFFVPREKHVTVAEVAVAEFKRFDPGVVSDEARVEGVSTSPVENVLNKMFEQVVAFRRVGADSMDAVLRPDRGTEISLHLSLHSNGQVEVAARVERGNFEGLQEHWSELQTSLAQQGVRVGELHQSTSNKQTAFHEPSQNFGAATGEGQQSQHHASRAPETLDELPLVGSVTEPLKGRTSKPTGATRRGWEKWA
jgi:hypothetical protein